MGGNALANVQRLTSADHSRLLQRIKPLLQQHYGLVSSPRYIGSKETHGDIDFLVHNPLSQAPVSLAKLLNATDSVSNGNITSLNVDGFQVDVQRLNTKSSSKQTCSCFLGPESKQTDKLTHDNLLFEAASDFADFGDCARIVGSVAKRYGLEYSNKGLSVNHGSVSIALTHSIPSALSYLQFPASLWTAGFSTEREMFDFLTASPLFNKTHAMLWISSGTSKRDLKHPRPTLKRFLEYLVDLNGGALPTPAQIDAFRVESEGIDKDQVKVDAIKAFGLWDLYLDLEAKQAALKVMDDYVKSVFNGRVIQGIIGDECDGASIGLVKARVRERLDRPLTETVDQVFGEDDQFTDGPSEDSTSVDGANDGSFGGSKEGAKNLGGSKEKFDIDMWKMKVLFMSQSEVEALILSVWREIQQEPKDK
ncbi:hypothetical protein BCR33DRAFT_415662 [Rhizoclosmatium globosum]|uniref:Uncharacterized protein n=1 Tax=Rhizoclosmatium globosum TaxID=329046 RepID=A0A1Y2BW54_9FUNG|nr:hypothetical protein BCR33DRAFT_415662 [Rhizoclosmatium globosum]|eukprot:ORY38990.1 hypothetical protein BCR33DRAFT_415662 [Rhizoclosmatium globosum]